MPDMPPIPDWPVKVYWLQVQPEALPDMPLMPDMPPMPDIPAMPPMPD